MQAPEKLLNFSFKTKLPVVYQTEAAECGLACLAMIAAYHGYETDMSTLRRRFSISSHGSTLKQIMDIAGKLLLTPRALKVDIESLDKLQMPCMLHWDLNHFVVLKEIRRNKYVVHDPAFGERVFTRESMERHFTGVAVEFTPNSDFTPKEDKRELKLRHFWDSIRGIKRSLFHVILLALLLQLFAIIAPFYMQLVVDDVIVHQDQSLLVALAFGFGLLVVIQTATSLFRSVILLNLSSRLNIQMTANLYRHLIRLPMSYFQKRHMGDVLSRVGSLRNVRDLITSGVVAAIIDGIMVIFTLVVMFYYSTKLTFVVLIVVSIYAAMRYIFYRPIKRLNEEALIAGAKMDSHNMESIRAIQTIKVYQKEGDRQNQWYNKIADVINNNIRVAQWNMGFNSSNQLLFGVENILVVYFGAIAVIEGSFSVGMLMAFMSHKGRFVGAINALVDQWIQFKMIEVHLGRLADIAFTPAENVDSHIDISNLKVSETEGNDVQADALRVKGKIEARGLAFSYGEEEDPVFEDVSFVIEAGETVAIVGPSGTGKTTLLKCLMGMLEPTSGEILIDNVPIQHQLAYRSQICGVMQDDQLLSGSISDNISCFAPQIDMNRVVESAKLACVHPEIMAMPMQYNTLIGDMGSSLSGGQKQRVILARAIYRKPRMLFLDEATSHLDIDNESKISANIRNFDITRIIVAHRPETIATANRTISLGKDGLVKSGKLVPV